MAKNEPFNISPFFFLELSIQCVRACVRRVHACVQSFRVASCGSLTFELSNRLKAMMSEYRPVIVLGCGSCRLTRRVVLGAELIQSARWTIFKLSGIAFSRQIFPVLLVRNDIFHLHSFCAFYFLLHQWL